MKLLWMLLTAFSLYSQVKTFEVTDSICPNIFYDVGRISLVKGRNISTYSYKGELVNSFLLDADCKTNWQCYCSQKLLDDDNGFEYLYNIYDEAKGKQFFKLIDEGVTKLSGEGSASFGIDENGLYLLVKTVSGISCYFLRSDVDIATGDKLHGQSIKRTATISYNLKGQKIIKVKAKSVIIKTIGP